MEKDNYILGIETSCDETAVAVVKNGVEIVSNSVASQIESHKRFGGVVPEIASRHHAEAITVVLEEAFETAQVSWDDIAAIAVTEGPGLVGALLVGVNAAKALAFAKEKPLVGVNHMAGHIYANRFVREFEFPLVALIVSGGHTELVLMNGHGSYRVVGETRDDAAGEAYDKVARVLELPYPGGPEIDRLARVGRESIAFPRAWLEKDSFDFSFSGLKSSVINTIHNAKQRGEGLATADVAASFQASVVDVLTTKTVRAAETYDVKQVVLAGGVAANTALREALSKKCTTEGMPLTIPPMELCTDNAAMIAAAGSVHFARDDRAGWDLNAHPGLAL